MRKAAMKYNIPYTSFWDHLYGVRMGRVRGVNSVLTEDKERQLADFCMAMAERGHGLSPTALKMKVTEITMGRVTLFRDGIPRGGG